MPKITVLRSNRMKDETEIFITQLELEEREADGTLEDWIQTEAEEKGFTLADDLGREYEYDHAVTTPEHTIWDFVRKYYANYEDSSVSELWGFYQRLIYNDSVAPEDFPDILADINNKIIATDISIKDEAKNRQLLLEHTIYRDAIERYILIAEDKGGI